MKNSEDAIEKVLAGLRNPDAPVGMERRILEALQDQASARSRSGWRRLKPIWLAMPARPVATRSLACGVALAGMLAVALAIPAIRRLGHAPAQSKMNPAPAGSLPRATPEGVAKSAQRPLPGSSVRSMEQTNAREKTTVLRARDVRNSDRPSDSVALDEMRAASHPAPPMPLTEQERLLLRIAHRGDPVELAMLDPMRRAERDVEEQREFQRFFKPRTIEQPTADQPTTEQSAVGQPATPQSTTEQLTPAQPTTEAAKPGDNE
jgi:hypothetical protein